MPSKQVSKQERDGERKREISQRQIGFHTDRPSHCRAACQYLSQEEKRVEELFNGEADALQLLRSGAVLKGLRGRCRGFEVLVVQRFGLPRDLVLAGTAQLHLILRFGGNPEIRILSFVL